MWQESRNKLAKLELEKLALDDGALRDLTIIEGVDGGEMVEMERDLRTALSQAKVDTEELELEAKWACRRAVSL